MHTYCFKTARITAINQIGNKKYVKFDRPISPVPFLNKPFEKLVQSRLCSFFDNFKIFFTNKIVFVINKATTEAIL